MALAYATATQNAQVASLTALLDGGPAGATVKVYSGTKPANANTAPSGNTLLLTFTMGSTSFAAPSAGSASANGLPLSAAGAATATAAWFRAADSTGATVFDGVAGVTGSGQDIELSTLAITTGLTVNLTAATLTQPA